MAKGPFSAQATYSLYGPQKGYDDPKRSLHVLAQGVNDVSLASEFKRMKLFGEIRKSELIITDQATGSSFSASIEYKNGDRHTHVIFHRASATGVSIENGWFKFWHYRGGDVARTLLRQLRGAISKEEPLKGDDDLTTYEASKFLNIKESKVGTLRNDPYGPPWYKEGNRVYFPREQLARWREENQEELARWREKFQPRKP